MTTQELKEGKIYEIVYKTLLKTKTIVGYLIAITMDKRLRFGRLKYCWEIELGEEEIISIKELKSKGTALSIRAVKK